MLRLMGKAMGGLWVGGRVTLTSTHLTFGPNRLSANLNEGEVSFAVALADIRSVETRLGVGTSIVEVRTADGRARFRCWRATAFAEKIRAAVSAA